MKEVKRYRILRGFFHKHINKHKHKHIKIFHKHINSRRSYLEIMEMQQQFSGFSKISKEIMKF